MRRLGIGAADVEPEHGPCHRTSAWRRVTLGVLCAGRTWAGSGFSGQCESTPPPAPPLRLGEGGLGGGVLSSGCYLIGAGSRGSAPGGSAVSGGPGAATGRIGPEPPGAGVHPGAGPLVVGTLVGGVLGGARCEAIFDRRRSLRGWSPRRPTRTQTRVRLPSAGTRLEMTSRSMVIVVPSVVRVVILPLLPSFSLDTRGKPSSCSAFCTAAQASLKLAG